MAVSDLAEQMGQFQNYEDKAYESSQRLMAPQQLAQTKRFDQQMINKGFAPGSSGYNLAQSQMQRGQNDQQNSAAFGAMQFGLGAQQQAFGQDYQNRDMAMQKDQFGRSLAQNESQFGRNLGQRESEFGRSLGEQGRQFDTGMSQRESEFGRNFGMQQGQMDFNNMIGLGDFGMRYTDFENRNTMMDYNMAGNMLGQAPGGSFQQIDTQGAYNTAQTGANNVYQGQMGAYNSMMGAVGNVAGAFAMPSALEFKILDGRTTQTMRNKVAAKMLTMPVYTWDYKPQYREKGDQKRFGVLANDFNRHFIDDEDVQTIDVQRYLSALHVTMQELFGEVRRLEQLLCHVAEARGIPLDARPYKGSKLGKVFDMADVIDKSPRSWTPVGED